jgi:hypothetical protein
MRLAHTVAAALLLLSSAGGCALFGRAANEDSATTAGRFSLPWLNRGSANNDELTAILPVARLQASIVTRPASDPRLRRLVWEELDESGLMAPELRQRLNRSGFRVGVAGSATPWALQSLTKDATNARRDEDRTTPVSVEAFNAPVESGPVFDLMKNGRSVLELQSGLSAQTLSAGRFSVLDGVRDTSGLRCVLEVAVREVGEDSVVLSILPQIHTGSATTRFQLDNESDPMPVRQNIVPLYDQQFTVRLHAGEIAVIGRQEAAEDNAGELFFRPRSGSSAEERLLMLRFVGTEKLTGQSESSLRLTTGSR